MTSCDNSDPISQIENTIDYSTLDDGNITLKSGAVVEKKGNDFYFQGGYDTFQRTVRNFG
ncbi:hypothetical protein JCM19274_4976 [Algibacter lectus]|uniref:Uncharacterized protein n=1 Tax=Algibacter lectus TaxID=221126 RepID=A0A090WM18_9FLAO|nr:hypothetical protein [Algibacter lectus]GAL77263.1 hypothetical protein JCM19274_4976 [Algibacter lectus]